MKTKNHSVDPGPAIILNNRRTRNFICLVDAYRRPSRQRNTAGRYRVGAKNPKQARKLLQSAVGFGSVQVYYEDNTTRSSDLVPLGECRKETFVPGSARFSQEPVRHACCPKDKAVRP